MGRSRSFQVLWAAIAAGAVMGTTPSAVGQTFPGRLYATTGTDVVSADVNRDGTLDLIGSSSYVPSPIPVRIGLGDGTFLDPVYYDVAGGSTELAVGDLNGDGVVDIVTSSLQSDLVSVLLGTPAGGFVSGQVTPVAPDAADIVIGDVNADGHLDVVVCSREPGPPIGRLSILLGDGNGGLVVASAVEIPARPYSVAIADLDGDDDLDLVTANPGTDGCFQPISCVAVLLNSGDGTFPFVSLVPVECNPRHVAIGDLNRDGNLDLVTAQFGELISGDVQPGSVASDYSDEVALLLGDGTGQFSVANYLLTSPGSATVCTADVDGDGIVDVVNGCTGRVALLRGHGDGTFEPHEDTDTGGDTWSVVVADFNVDGIADLALGVFSYAAAVAVLLGDGDGSFTAGKFTVPSDYTELARIHDLDDDGTADVLMHLHAMIRVALGLTTGGFAPSVSYPSKPSLSGNVLCEALGDLNGDELPDALTATPQVLSVVLSDGTGGISAPLTTPISAQATGLCVEDADGDPFVDVVVALRFSSSSGALLVLSGDGQGHFSVLVTLPTSFSPNGAVAVGDITGDGLADLVCGSGSTSPGNPGTLWIAAGTGPGAFGALVGMPTGVNPLYTTIVDIDGDGLMDLGTVLSDYLSGSLEVRYGEVGGGLSTAHLHDVGTFPSAFAIGDLNADGLNDIAVGSLSASVLFGDGSRGFVRREYVGGGRITLGDVQGDGLLDIGVSNAGVTLIPNLGPPSPFQPCGPGLVGIHGVPELAGTGPIIPTQDFSLDLTNARENSAAALVVGLYMVSLPTKGGFLFPSPDVVLFGLPTDAVGSLSLHPRWPVGLPPGNHLFFQCWVLDAAGPQGFSASNGLVSTSP